jgi:pyruvate ferredoxin oxidoreductase gamma subunit
MLQVRIHGRGGQGVVTAAELLSLAAFREGRHAQAFPSFGSERMGAPVVAFCRIDDRTIRNREPVLAPDALIIQDPTLLHQVDVFAGTVRDAWILINTSRDFAALGLRDFVAGFHADRLCTVPATEIALRRIGRPVPNAALLGGFAALSGQIGIESVCAAIGERFAHVGAGHARDPARIAEQNKAAAREAFEHVRAEKAEANRAQAN